MIGNDAFVGCFGIVPAADDEALPALVRNAVRQGFAIVPIAPGAKTPICTLTVRQAKAADTEAREAARVAGRPGWERVRHSNSGDCGIGHALTDPDKAAIIVRRLMKDRGGLNIGVEVGRSRMVHIDADTAAEMAGFLADWSHETGQDMTGRRPTVVTPGKVKVTADGTEKWVHKDGGHFWFTVPPEIDLVTLPGPGTLAAESGWVASWKDHQALVPPSSRPEGAYVITGQVEPAPEWLLDRIQMHAHSFAERQARQRERIRHDGDPIDAWSADVAWDDLLGPDEWTNTGLPDNCGCPIWTRPGDPGHHKSATAHQLGCVRFDTLTGHGPLHIWTDNPPEFLADAMRSTGKRTFTKLEYIAWRDHGGRNYEAMRDLDLEFLGDGDEQAQVDALLDGLDFLAPGTGQSLVATAPEAVAAPSDPSDPQVNDGADGDDLLADVEDDQPPADDIPPELAELRGNPKLLREVVQIALRDQAKTFYDRLRNRSSRVDMKARIKAATDRLDRVPDDEEEVPWRIADLWQQGQTVLLSAAYKSGKTTMVLNIIRSLVDGKPFLGQFDTTAVERNVYVVNAEMTGRQFRRWLREAGIGNRDKVYALHVREAGASAGDILDPGSRELLIEELTEADAQVLILDPLNPMLSAAGVDENASTEVAKWFNALADLVERSPVEDVLLVHHFGHNGERGRGSSKFMDAPDALWTYTKGEQSKGKRSDDDEDDLLGEIDAAAEPRFLAAIGRDVDLAKSRVDFDASTRTLVMPVVGAGPNRTAERAARTEMQHEQLIGHLVSFVVANPGISSGALYEKVGGKKDRYGKALQDAENRGLIVNEGTSRSKKFVAVGASDPSDPVGPKGGVRSSDPPCPPTGQGPTDRSLGLTHQTQDQGPTEEENSPSRGDLS